ncbi:MAG: NUDIX domain-containing protein [bacterium]|nr:NUDIX domain-containing protein [bacterium]
MQVKERVLHKVTAFVTRTSAAGRELLVFEHPHAGVQLPAGTVEANEEPEQAALREVREETGLVRLSLRGCLGAFDQPMPERSSMIFRDSMLQSTPQRDATLIRQFLRRGLPVEVGDEVNQFVKVTFRETDLRTGNVIAQQSGWIPVISLAERVVRSCFQVEAEPDTPDQWHHQADRDHTFALFWVPLDSDPGLHPAQAEWLTFARAHGLH